MIFICLTSTNEYTQTPENDKLDFYINRIGNNDKNALAELYHMTSAAVYGFALSILKNTQDADY
jgi:hypothetical protein